ncbi:hypothetical protein A5819_003630 [Enterococcus sp. 7E2_DIV0204]|uniref:DUF6262 family protein n=1 Tax=unclassified Enterococcus TaxID=2608891 RepID=UPI000A343CB4|nr:MULTISPECIES: DUF6262 family protein [unclassified Enterococcus]OTN83811.1 hypothetical protein A5819_003630 [Enterococcus sp. 7E2_DIV0204]OTP47537.1 hypothetical protein A5884_003508 [Enterococcus sp. 7D2_DIV0200]
MVFDQKEHLKKVHENRRKQTLNRINQAINYLQSIDQPINFSRVAKQAGIGKSTLYTIPEVREEIIVHRNRTLQKSYKQVNISKSDSMIRSLKRKIINLEKENKDLKEQIKRMYGELFERTTHK